MNAITTRSALFLVFLTALALRGLNHAQVFDGGDGVVFPAYDAYYHLSRALAAMRNFPWVPLFDGGMNYPYGAAVIWPPLFDFMLAAAGIIAGGPENVPAVETALAWLIPLTGAATVFPLYWLIIQITGRREEALAGAALLAVTPAHILYSGVGYVDHHAAVTFLHTLMFALFFAAYRGSVKSLAAAALTMAAGLLTWNGFILYVAILDVWLLWLMAAEGRRDGSRVPQLMWVTHLCAAALVAPFAAAQAAASGKAFTGIMLSCFHVSALAGAGLFALALEKARPRGGELPLARFFAAAFVAAAFGVALAWRGPLAEGAGWLFTTERFMSMVGESHPFLLFSLDGFAFTCRWMSALWFVSPVVIAALSARALKQNPHDRGLALLIAAAASLFIMSAAQRRFGEAYAPALGAVMATGAGLWIRAAAPVPARLIRFALAMCLAMASFWGFYINPVRHLASASYPFSVTDMEGYYRRIVNTFRRMAGSGAPPGGMMTTLTLGHMARYEAGMPVVANNFGSHAGQDAFHDWAEFFLARDESHAAAILERRGIRYVAVDYEITSAASAAAILGEDAQQLIRMTQRGGMVSTEPSPRFMRSLWFRLSRIFGARAVYPGKRGGGDLTLPALTRFRLLVDSGKDQRPGDVKIFEFVRGARLVIQGGKPGAKVSIVYPFVSTAGRDRRWRDERRFDAAGAAVFHLPYSSELPQFGHSAKYLIETEGTSRRLLVPDKHVREGLVLTKNLREPS